MAEIVQLRRAKGWRKPDGAVTVSRPTRWGNPFVIGQTHRTPDGEVTPTSRAESVAAFRAWVTGSYDPEARWIREHIHELAGVTLACWCPQPGRATPSCWLRWPMPPPTSAQSTGGGRSSWSTNFCGAMTQ